MKRYTLLFIFLLAVGVLHSQMVTGVWRGTITKGKGLMAKSMKLEVKLIKKGDSLVGTSYYYVNPKMYMRYSVVGYFDVASNAVHWQDYRFVSSKPEHKAGDPDVVSTPMKNTTDFNCPNPNGVMKLDGYSEIGEGELFDTHLTKVPKSFFPDEWDNVIQGFTVGMAHPDVIDSVWAIASVPKDPVLVAKAEKEMRDKLAAEEKAKQEEIAKAKARVEAEEKVKQESIAKAKAEAEEKARQEEIAKARVEAEEKAKKDAIAKEKLAAEEKAKQDAIVKAQKEADEKGRQETIAKEKLAAEEKAKQDAIVKAQKEADEKARQEEIAKAKAEAEEDAIAKEKLAAEEKAKQDAIVKAQKEADEKAKKETLAREKAAAEEKARQDVVARAKAMEEKSKQDAIAKAAVAEKARQETIAKAKAAEEKTKQQAANTPKTDIPVASSTRPGTIPAIAALPEKQDAEAVKKFTTRKKIQQGELPMQGDSIELHFYDNAEVDGDSISLFVNGRLLFNHVKLSTQPFVFKMPVKELPDNSELAMVAENLGSIPPNTALMLAFIKGERLSFRLESTEQSTGTIKLVRRE
jgi:hypothetical protein